jgi:hypothetical protein
MLRFHPSAAKRGIARDRVDHVVTHARAMFAQGDHAILLLGPDQRGVPLEIVLVELEDGDVLVIHAMRMRRRYAGLYARVMRWQ